MEGVQIFGTKKCKETRKAERFFKERRIPIHFVDLKRKPPSKGELRRFVQKFGAEALLDRDAQRFRDRGLHVAHLSEDRVATLVEEDPELLVTPLVRMGKHISVGHAETQWKEWVA